MKEVMPTVIPRIELTKDNVVKKIKSFSKLGGMCYFKCNITPDVANIIIEELEDINRDRRPGTVKNYAGYMLAGNWKLCPDPIMFDTKGVLADGGHSVESVIVSKTTSPFVVCCGISEESKKVIDEIIPRTVIDVSQLNDKLRGQIQGIHSSVMRSMVVESPASLRITLPKLELLDFICNNFKIINEIVLLVKNPKYQRFVRHSAVLAPITRAYASYIKNKEKVNKIVRFVEILTGEIKTLDVGDDIVHDFREWLIKKFADKKSTTKRKVIYNTTENVLWMYLHGRQCEKMTEARVEYFPVDFGKGSQAYFDYHKPAFVRKHGGKRLTRKPVSAKKIRASLAEINNANVNNA